MILGTFGGPGLGSSFLGTWKLMGFGITGLITLLIVRSSHLRPVRETSPFIRKLPSPMRLQVVYHDASEESRAQPKRNYLQTSGY